jgi:transcriptional regulator with XRE-family HTH domain
VNDDLKNILSKVRDLYMKYGIKSITMDDVAREMGISKKTLYQYVNDKEELVEKFIENEKELRQKEICDCFKVGYNPVEELIEISLYMNKLMQEQNPATEYDLKKYYPSQYQKLVKARREGIYNYILANLKKGKLEGLYCEDLKEEIIAKLYLSISESIHLNDLYSVEEFTSIRIYIELLKYHVRGIATEKGIIALEKKLKELEMDKIK